MSKVVRGRLTKRGQTYILEHQYQFLLGLPGGKITLQQMFCVNNTITLNDLVDLQMNLDKGSECRYVIYWGNKLYLGPLIVQKK